MCLSDEPGYISGTRSPYIDDKVRMALRDARLAMSQALQTCCFYKATCMVIRRIFEDRACALLWRLCTLSMLLVVLDSSAQRLRISSVQVYGNLRDDFRRFDQLARRAERKALFIELDAPQSTEATMPVGKFEFVMLVASFQRHCRLRFRFTRINDVHP